MSLADLRNEYERFSLSENELCADPRQQFQRWLDQAIELKEVEPTAMTLATVNPEGRPSARIVLLKGYDEQGLVFFTNYQSRKGTDLDHNPWASLSFFWASMQRQGALKAASAASAQPNPTNTFTAVLWALALGPGPRRKANPSAAQSWMPVPSSTLKA